MTRRRWIADEVSGDQAAVTGAHANHLVRVIRVKVGQRFDISTGATVREGVITTVADSRVEFKLGDNVPISSILPSITLALSIFKFDRMEWAIEKCTELGVAGIIPIVATRTDNHLAAAANKRVERWQRLARQASEQSRRRESPHISQPVRVKEILEFASSARIVLSEFEKEVSVKDVVCSPTDRTILAIGPEGGWTPGELDLFLDAGWISAALGETILRVETAAIAAVTIILSESW